MSTFKALRIHRVEGGTRSRFDAVSLHDLTPGEVVIRVAYSCLNYKDALAVTGNAPITRGAVRTAGIDLSGVVESSSDGSFAPGDRVLVTGSNIGESLDGGFAQFARVPAQAVVPLPAQLGLFEAMVLGTAGFTAAMAVWRMQENHQVADHGPSRSRAPTGGVGSIALAILKRAGFTTAAITGKADAAAEYLRHLGADEIVDRKTLDFGAKPLETSDLGRGSRQSGRKDPGLSHADRAAVGHDRLYRPRRIGRAPCDRDAPHSARREPARHPLRRSAAQLAARPLGKARRRMESRVAHRSNRAPRDRSRGHSRGLRGARRGSRARPLCRAYRRRF